MEKKGLGRGLNSLFSDYNLLDDKVEDKPNKKVETKEIIKEVPNIVEKEVLKTVVKEVPTTKPIDETSTAPISAKKSTSNMKSHAEKLENMNEDAKNVYVSVCDYIESLGDDISMNQVKYYVAYKKIQNFVCIEVYKDAVTLYLKLDPKDYTLEETFSRDVSSTGHRGTGDLEITLRNLSDFEKAKEYISKAYENS